VLFLLELHFVVVRLVLNVYLVVLVTFFRGEVANAARAEYEGEGSPLKGGWCWRKKRD
jgi:hypothetical protein